MSAAAPSTTTTTASPWRTGVIGAVALLAAGIGLAAGAFLMTSRTAAIGAGAAYVPADAVFYVEMRLEPSAAQDAALRDFLGAFPAIEGLDLERPLSDQLAERLDEMLADEGASVTWADDVAPWFDGRVALAVPELPAELLAVPPIDSLDPETPFPTSATEPPVVVMLGVTDRAAAAAAIDRIVAEAGQSISFEETTHAGVTVNVMRGDEPGAWALVDDQLLFAPSAEEVNAAIDAHADPSATLAEAQHLAALNAQLPADWLAFVTYDMTELVAASWDQMATMAPEMSDAFDSLLDQPLRGAMALTAGADRLALDVASDAPTGPLAVANTDRGLAGEVPADTLFFAEGGNIGASLAAVIGPIKEAAAATPEGAEQVAMIEAALGADLEELVSWIDHGALALGWGGTEPYGGLVLVPSDADAAARRLGQLGTFASLASMDPSSGISVENREVAGSTVTTIRWEDPSAASPGVTVFAMPVATGVTVEYTVTDDRALVGIGEGFVERVLTLDGGSLADEPRYRDAIADLGGASNAGATWLDLTGMREAIEAVAQPQLDEMDTDGAYERDILPWLEPLDRLVQVSVLEGYLLVKRSSLLVE